MTYDEKTLQCIKEIGEKVDLRSVQKFTPKQEEYLRVLVEQVTLDAMDEGLALAVRMIRECPTGLTRDQLANLIERCIGDETYPLTSQDSGAGESGRLTSTDELDTSDKLNKTGITYVGNTLIVEEL
jgi:hypothetical protein